MYNQVNQSIIDQLAEIVGKNRVVTDKEELLENILERAASLIGTEHGYIYLRTPDGRRMQMQMGKGFFKGQLGRKVLIGEGVGGQGAGGHRAPRRGSPARLPGTALQGGPGDAVAAHPGR